MALRVIEQGWSLTQAAAAAEVSDRTCSKWVRRHRAEGELGLLDRSSAPRSISGVLARIGWGRLGRLGRLGLEPAQRYQRERPGELIHIDVNKLGRRQIVGWEHVHIAIDDCTRLANAEALPDDKAATAIAFLRRAIACYRRHGITVERVLTDNGSAYNHRRRH